MKITLKALRVNNGDNQENLAKKLGVSTKTVCSWEKGKTFPSPKYIDKICVLYNVSYDNIIFFKK